MRRSTGILGVTLVLVILAGCTSPQPDLAKGFQTPPDSAKPHTWWHWMNGNITREGITADLEAMKRAGLGGAQIFNVSENIPEGSVAIMSPEWRELVKYAAKEANRLGLELCMHNCSGWSSSGGPWIKPEFAMQMVVISETHAEGPARFSTALPQPATRRNFYQDIAVLAFPTPQDNSRRIKDIKPKAGYEPRYGQHPALDVFPPESIVKRDNIVDLTSKLAADGHLSWDVPSGDWTILRIGYTPTGAENSPSPKSGRGLECDKLSRAGLDAHWAGMMGPVVHDLGPLAGKTLKNCLIDSYEMGGQNWTPRFREEFIKRRGYDPLLLLPVLTGRVIDSGEVSERFLWDLRRTIADLFADNYYGYFAELCHRNGLMASIEPYDGPFECLLVGKPADIPMGEFWVGGGESNSCKLAASVAHIYGQKIIGAESFTAEPNRGRWQNHPFSLKAVGDLMYTTGINRYIIHRYAHQPWLDKFPGMTMGQWGTHFERTVTWWKQSPAWLEYLTRCQYLLQQGLFVADVCYFAGETAPQDAPHNPTLKAKGYDYDACNADILLNRTTVKDGRLVLADGMSYRLLVLPDTPFMTARLLTKVRDLIQQGATVIGSKPTRSPSLADYPNGDATVQKLADEVWGDCDGKNVKEHAFGKGRVMWGKSPEEVLVGQGIIADCVFTAAPAKPKMAWIHRRADSDDLYFVSNQRPRSEDVQCTFRVSGKVPELWHADTGLMEQAPIWSEKDGRTTLPIHFDPAGSVFVVFQKAAGKADHITAVNPPTAATTEPALPRIEIRKAMYEAIDGAGGTDVTAKVAALVEEGEFSIPANNQTFGDPTYNHLKRLRVEYTLNGQPMTGTAEENGTLELAGSLGSVGMPPWRLAALEPGKLSLQTFQPGVFEFQTASGRTAKAEVKSVPAPVEIAGPWTVRFPPDWGAPASITLDKLISWTSHDDVGVRYFSGTAEYENEFEVPPALMESGKRLYLDLGQVNVIAEVSLNGRDLGVWWKPPFAADITNIAKPGKNALKVRVTNLWVNRLVGDEQHPDDCEWNGVSLKSWPQWLVENRPRPVKERLTFTTWKHYTRNSTPLESGLLGPVLLRAGQLVVVE
ncbi:MAG TPA: glycosyl hydrolase [Phycisphaerae bacterium]|nr:glycosyl hydrolase [Phycisphaerae bacterium]